ncbi:MAG: hypothetical protein HXN12_00380 [Porphyromonadaceae bacterium]|nr:hypothetical protein [Porphyromonadaceae bacterium]
MKNTIELAAEFIRRAAFVDANALLKDECGVEYKKPSQVQYYALFKDHGDSKAINEALKHVADMLGCMTSIEYQRPSSSLTIVGEEAAVNIVRHVWRTALKTYETALNERVSKASIKSREEFRQWSEDYILGFFEGLTARHSYVHPRILGLLDGMK